MSLTPKRQRFVEEYLVDLNATQAAIRAGYSPISAHAEGGRLLNDVKVAEALKAAMDARSARTEITADRVLRELAKLGFADIRKAVKWGSRLVERPFNADQEAIAVGDELEEQPQGGALKRTRRTDDGTDAFYVTSIELTDSEELDDDTAAAVAEIGQTKEGVRIKFHDKKGALESIGKHLGMFKERHEHSGPDGAPIPITTIRLAGPE